ncbi:MAG: DUF2202 domain-containing protein [Saprospiraceae bacterium]|nr:DUF2202 domain-containing protein [Saprospiraceae bacterium]
MRPFTMIFGIITVLLMSAFIPNNAPITYNDTLTENEKAGLVKMREEEKLAFEVYTFLDAKWDHQVFKNIKQSEARHGELVKGLIDQFGIKDPYIAANGQYANAEMQKLYQELTTKGSQSLKDAFIVGAIIEDMDIADLDILMAATTNKDLLGVYDNLNRGSRNHIRAFSRQLGNMDVVYTPTYIHKDRYTAIINGDHEEGTNCQSNNSNCKSKGNKACGSNSGKACAGNGNNKSCGDNKGNCKSGKGNKKGCCSK